jgi:hypothetical protein
MVVTCESLASENASNDTRKKIEKENMVRKNRKETGKCLAVGYEVRPAVVSFPRARKKIVCGEPKAACCIVKKKRKKGEIVVIRKAVLMPRHLGLACALMLRSS